VGWHRSIVVLPPHKGQLYKWVGPVFLEPPGLIRLPPVQRLQFQLHGIWRSSLRQETPQQWMAVSGRLIIQIPMVPGLVQLAIVRVTLPSTWLTVVPVPAPIVGQQGVHSGGQLLPHHSFMNVNFSPIPRTISILRSRTVKQLHLMPVLERLVERYWMFITTELCKTFRVSKETNMQRPYKGALFLMNQKENNL
jgi:hypothetical protein